MLMKNKDSLDSAIERVSIAIEAIKAGKMVIMTDDEDRENEGDLVFAAEDVTAEKINFMITKAKGLVCLSLEPKTIDKLGLPLMDNNNFASLKLRTAFTVSIEAREGVTTGISAADRAHTIRTAINPTKTSADLVVPGHIFPLKAKPGGVLERVGHTEGSVDLARLAGKTPAAVICEIINEDGTMARRPDLEQFAQHFQIPIVSIADLVSYRLTQDTLVDIVKTKPVKTEMGEFTGVWFKSAIDQLTHFALVKGQDFSGHIVDVRVQKQAGVLDVFGSRQRITYGLKMLKENTHGVLVYLANNQDESLTPKDDSSPMDPRTYGIGAQILKTLGVSRMRLHASSEKQLVALKGFGLDTIQTKLIP